MGLSTTLRIGRGPRLARELLRRPASALDAGVDGFEATSARGADVACAILQEDHLTDPRDGLAKHPTRAPLTEDLEKQESVRGAGATVWQRAGQGIPAVREAITMQRS